MKPRAPKGPYRVISKGTAYWYAWKGRGAPRLPGEPGSDEFLIALGEARAARKGGSNIHVDTISGLVRRYQASPEWKKNSPATHKLWGRWLSKIDEHFGPLRIVTFNRPEIRRDIRDWRNRFAHTPRAADTAIQVLSRLLTHAVNDGTLTTNACNGINQLYENSRAEIIWTDDELAALSKVASHEIMWAARLAILTGLRQDDLRILKWSEVHDNAIIHPTGKSRGRVEVIVPIYAELRKLLKEIPRRAETVLTNTYGEAWGSGLSDWFGDRAAKAGIVGKTFNDLRGTAATKLYLSSLSTREIAEIMGWEPDRVERIIRRYVEHNALVKERVRKLDENASKTKTEKLWKNRTVKSG